MRRATPISALMAGLLTLAGCTGGSGPGLLLPPALPSAAALTQSLPKISLPSLPALPSLPKADPVIGTPTELYTRIARGAVECWFSRKGFLKGRYIYHADASPASQGGRAEIVIHAIDPESPNPRGQRVYLVSIVPEGETATLATQNLKLPAALGETMTRDVHRWAAAGLGCDEAALANGWSPQDPAAIPAPRPAQKGKRNRVPAAAASAR